MCVYKAELSYTVPQNHDIHAYVYICVYVSEVEWNSVIAQNHDVDMQGQQTQEGRYLFHWDKRYKASQENIVS